MISSAIKLDLLYLSTLTIYLFFLCDTSNLGILIFSGIIGESFSVIEVISDSIDLNFFSIPLRDSFFLIHLQISTSYNILNTGTYSLDIFGKDSRFFNKWV